MPEIETKRETDYSNNSFLKCVEQIQVLNNLKLISE